jgi:AcrR family transcriptional regulator
VPRAGLSEPILIAEAQRLADECGFEQLTLAALAARFGVAVPSLYKHLDGLAAVRRGVAFASLAVLGEALDGAPDLRGIGHAYRRWALDHPGRYAATVQAATTDDMEHQAVSARVMARVTGVLEAHGLRDEAVIDGARLLRSTLHGFVTLEAGGGFAMARDVARSFERALDALEVGLGVLADGPSAARPPRRQR